MYKAPRKNKFLTLKYRWTYLYILHIFRKRKIRIKRTGRLQQPITIFSRTKHPCTLQVGLLRSALIYLRSFLFYFVSFIFQFFICFFISPFSFIIFHHEPLTCLQHVKQSCLFNNTFCSIQCLSRIPLFFLITIKAFLQYNVRILLLRKRRHQRRNGFQRKSTSTLPQWHGVVLTGSIFKLVFLRYYFNLCHHFTLVCSHKWAE